MRIGELKINGRDAATAWGAFMSDGSLSALMTPAPIKEYVSNSSRLEDGRRVIPEGTKVESRDLTLTIHIKASNRDQFFARYLAFVEELHKGVIVIETKYQPDVRYKCLYVSCSQFAQYNGRLGKFTLKLNEPNPKDRSNND